MARTNKLAKKISERVELANERVENDFPINFDGKVIIDNSYCVLNDIECGELTSKGLEIYRPEGKKSSYHASINGDYNDPDEISAILYLLIVKKYKERIETEYGIRNFKVSIRGDKGKYRYMYCITAEYDKGRCIKLAGDWAISWSFIADFSKEKQIDVAKITHTIIGHPLWPCNMVEKRQTVNQARGDKISMKDTLQVLQKCFNNDFDEKKMYVIEGEDFSNLANAFCDYKQWYQKFGSYEGYVEFWDLKRFEENITKDNINQVFAFK